MKWNVSYATDESIKNGKQFLSFNKSKLWLE